LYRFILTAKMGIMGMIVMMLLLTSKLLALPLANAAGGESHNKRSGIGSFLPIPKDLITPPNQNFPLPSNAISGSDIPKNLIIGPSCSTSCPPIIGTNKDDILYGVLTTDAIIYGLKGDDVITGGPGNSKLYGGDGNDEINGGSGNAQMYGGNGDDVLIGGSGNNILVGGPGNDQLYAGTGTDTLIGGPGADFFNCGTQTGTGGSPSSAVILDFNPGEGDTKASNCKYVFTVGGAPAAP
jgi:RTX calcium-binding nonapeptide repeat (4 copies)